MEKGIRLGTMTLKALKKTGQAGAALRNFGWFYIGAEFCENLLTPALCEEAAALQSEGKKVCLLTPPVSGTGIKALDALFGKLAGLAGRGRIAPSRLEITVNDFGALELAKRRLPRFKLNSGRLLFDNIFEGTRKKLWVHSFGGLELFRELGVVRHEVSATGLRRRTNFSRAGRAGGGFRLTLYYPYLNLTSARACPVGLADHPSSGGACAKECLACSFEVDHPAITEKLIIRGNTVFLEFPRKFYSSEKDLRGMNVDRLVYCPFP
jgi:hypothetical protein